MSNTTTPPPNCGEGGGDDAFLGLRVASVFIILGCSCTGALFPVLAKRSTWLHVPAPMFKCVMFTLMNVFSNVYSPMKLRKVLWLWRHRGFPTGCFRLPLSNCSFQIATGFIHLLDPGIQELTSPCLSPAFQEYVRCHFFISSLADNGSCSHTHWRSAFSAYFPYLSLSCLHSDGALLN